MKQILQSPRTGKLELLEVPVPAVESGQVLVRNHFSVVSPGTEKMAMDFARLSMLGKARSRPDLVKQVTRKLRQDGPLPTYRTVMSRLDSPQPLGYSCAGVVEVVGPGVVGFAPGDRVACAGAGYANHAELVCVPENLVARVPDTLTLSKAAFATLGAIALQGLRVVQPVLGEVVAVIGLGLIGQLAVQLLHANGCRVLGVDLDPARVKQALDLGAESGASPEEDHSGWRDRATGGHGADLVLVTAASENSAPIRLAAELCRMKGRIGVVGATSMDLDRRLFFEKELELRMSMSYGPGRYDRRYEELGLDYPLAYVRWTENRNLQAFLALAENGQVDPERMDVKVVAFENAERTYEELVEGGRRGLAVIFRYAEEVAAARTLSLPGRVRTRTAGEVGIAFVGAGNYAKGILLPAVDRCRKVRKVSVVTATGPSARRTAEKFGYGHCGTDPEVACADDDVDLVFVATQHDTHASLAEAALRQGKAVWLEKPVGITPEQVDSLASTVRETDGFLTVGYNRRFSPAARAVRALFADRSGPMALHYTVAAGATPGGTWHTDPAVGGGRIVGEACHFVDLFSYLVGSPPSTVYARTLGRDPETDDSVVSSFGFRDGSSATLHYLANASAELPKERWEASQGGRTAICNNFRETRMFGGKTLKSLNQDKGQQTAVAEVIEAVREGRASPFSLDEIVGVSKATFAILDSIRSGGVIDLC